MDTLIELLRLGSVGIISGLFSALLAIRGYRDKKWWELRVEAYKSLIEALSDLNYYFDSKYLANITNRELSDTEKEQLNKFWNEGYHKVRKAADSGAFLFSNEVDGALKKFMDHYRNDNHETYFEYLDSYSALIEECLKSVVNSAKKDLKIKKMLL